MSNMYTYLIFYYTILDFLFLVFRMRAAEWLFDVMQACCTEIIFTLVQLPISVTGASHSDRHYSNTVLVYKIHRISNAE